MKRILLIAAAAAVLVSLGSYWMRQQRSATQRLEAWKSERSEDAIPPAFAQSFQWEHANLTLGQFADVVFAKTGLKVEIDEVGIAAGRGKAGKSRDIQVLVPGGEFELHDLLQMVVMPAEIYPDHRGATIVLTTPENAAELTRLRTIVYPLPLDPGIGLDESAWRQIVAGNVDGHVHDVPGAIIVVATPLEQRRARLVIDTVQNLDSASREPVAIPPLPPSPVEEQLFAALETTAQPLDVVEMPLRDVVRMIVENNGVSIVLLANKVEEASVSLNTPITKSLRDVSLRALLRLVLKDLELTFVVRNQAIVITTPEDAERRVSTVAYPVHDLVIIPPDFPDFDPLADLVRAAIRPDSWGDGNGGTPDGVGDGWLLVENSDHVQTDVSRLLEALQQCLASAERAKPFFIDRANGNAERIETALDEPIEFNLADVALKDVVVALQKGLGIPIVLAAKKLEEASVSPDTPVTLKLPRAPAGKQLDAILKGLELDFVIRDEVLQITTPEDAESQLDVVVYDTRHLIDDRMPADKLVQLVRTTIWPPSWDNVGGPGFIDTFRGLSIVSQTRRVHEDLKNLLETLAQQPPEQK
jgi:hypothetical protein